VALWTVGEVLAFPVANAIVADLAPVHLRGRYQGAFTMSWGVAFTVSPLVAGEVLSRLGAPALWAGCLAVGLAVAAGHLAIAPARRRRLGGHSPR
jgi:MFS family permease